MMIEELGLTADNGNPVKDAIVTFFAFILFGLVPCKTFTTKLVLPFIVSVIGNVNDGLFIASTVLTAFILIVLGVSKSMFSTLQWYYSGLETLTIGALAAVAAYVIGLAFEGI
jgi:VIT1/CCC1 family predicted Fe2+/Mn2+ transporter